MQLYIKIYTWESFIFEDISISISQKKQRAREVHPLDNREKKKKKLKIKLKKIFASYILKHFYLESK